MFDHGVTESTGRAGLDPAAAPRGVYQLLNSVVVPRPIAWVSSRSADGVDNLAPHSYFTVASVAPPVVQFTSVGQKDSLRNIVETGEFVVSLCTEPLVEQVNLTAVSFPPDVSEFDAVGVAREPSYAVAPPRVAASPVAMECRLEGTHAIGDCTLVFGRVVWFAIRPEVLRDGRVAADLLRPVARLAGADYATIGDVFAVRRLSYAEWSAARRPGAGRPDDGRPGA